MAKIKLETKMALMSFHALQQLGGGKLPFQVSMDIAHNQRVLSPFVDDYEERRKELVVKMGVLDEATGHHNVAEKNQKKFSDTMEEWSKVEHEFEGLKIVDMGDFGKNFQVESNVLVPLEWMITLKGQTPTRSRRLKPV